jgi:leucyl/phenylalanyl-tRNA---protein transferase
MPAPRRRPPDLPPPLDPGLVVQAYAAGFFPMAMEHGRIGWFSPDPRGIIPLEGFHIPHGLRRTLRKAPFDIHCDRAFDQVLAGCAARGETWISREVAECYRQLHAWGRAHSVEAWQCGELVGGLYGVALGGAFFGESMFSRATDASKVCLVHLVERLRAGGFTLLDTQWTTQHLERFGATAIARDDYLVRLADALGQPGDWQAWERGELPHGHEW